MIIYVRNDLGCVQVSFAGLSVHMCDTSTNEVFDRIKKFLRRGGEHFSLEYFTLSSDGVVSVYTQGHENFVPTLTFSVKHLFTDNKSFLLRLYNIFAPKRRQLRYENGIAKFGSVNFHSGNVAVGRSVFDIG